MYIGLHVRHPLFSCNFNEICGLSTYFRKISSKKFYKNLSDGTRVVPCGQTEGQINIKKLIVDFRNLVNPSENSTRHIYPCQFLGYIGRVAEVFILVECDFASIDNHIPKFRGKVCHRLQGSKCLVGRFDS